MNYTIETLPNSNKYYMRHTGQYGTTNNFKMMEHFKKWILDNNFSRELRKNGILGIALDDPQEVASSECRYDLVLFVSQATLSTSSVLKGTFSGGKYAVFILPHTKEAVQNFWLTIHDTVKYNHLDVRNSPIIERFKEENGHCEMLIPIN